MRSPYRWLLRQLAIAASVMALTPAVAAPRPNIVLIMTDDAGYSDPGCYGGEIATPNIDALARQGIRFAKFYTNARCSPTRASLMTGMYPHRVGVGELCNRRSETPFPGYKRNMAGDVVTLAEAMRQAGYHTLMAGKWHLGGELDADADRRPRSRGFDRFFGLLRGAASYFEPGEYTLDDGRYDRGPEDEGESFYATRAISDFAVGFLRQARQKDRRPFFLYVAYTAPHTPLHAPKAALAEHRDLYRKGAWEAVRKARYLGLRRESLIDDKWKYSSLTPEQQRQFEGKSWTIHHMTRVAAMSSLVDDGVGRIAATLRELGELDNTLIVYLSDNGPDGFHASVGATPLTGSKRLLTEGGIATHCILHWPAGIRGPGRIERRPGHVIDLMPTCLELAGVRAAAPGIDGRSLLPVITGGSWKGHEILFWELYGQQAAIEDGRWKYLVDLDGKARLYDLREDPTETVDLAATHPSKMQRLSARYQSWAKANHVMPRDVLENWRQENLKAKGSG